jgi:cytosine/adenosine deaminase-related metal-dependent hydrolase
MENRDMSLLPAGRAIRLVTVEAAALLGMGHEIGSLEVGKKADIILIDLDQPHLVPCEDLANMVAFYVRGNDVDTVIVDGAVLMEGREVTTVNEAAVLEYAREEARRSFERIDVSPYLDHGYGFWQGWREAITQNQRASTVERGQS